MKQLLERPLLNQSLQGVGTIISAQPILQLTELAEAARREPVVQSFLLAETWMPESFRPELTSTCFLQAFVLPHLISGQFLEHCKLSFLQRIQPVVSSHFLRVSRHARW